MEIKEKTENKIKERSCSACGGAGWLDNPRHTCPTCGGTGYAEEVRGILLYWGKKMRGVPVAARSSVARMGRLVEISAWIVAILSLFAGAVNLADSLRAHDKLSLDFNLFFDIFFAGYATAPLWLGIALLIILYFHRLVYLKPEPIDPLAPYYRYILAEDVTRIKKDTRRKIDISCSASHQTRFLLRSALDLAFKLKQEPHALHLLYALITDQETGRLFLRLEIQPGDFLLDAQNQLKSEIKEGKAVLGGTYKKLLFEAFWAAVKSEDPTIEPQHLLFAIIKNKQLKSVLNKYGVSVADFSNIILWNKFRKIKSARFLSKDSFDKPRHRSMNRGWTAIQTPVLDQFSVDVTDYARVGWLLPMVGRKNEMRVMKRILCRSSKNNVLLIGEEGSGRDALAQGLAREIVRNRVDARLFDKRVVKLNVGMLGTGGASGETLKQRIEQIMNEVVRTQNVILYIPDLHELSKIQAFASMDIVSFLAPLFAKRVIQVIGSTTPADFRDHIEPRGEFAQTFDRVQIKELSQEDSLKVLSMQVPLLERGNGVLITYRAVEEAINQSARFMADRLLPQKAIDVLSEAIVRAKNVKGAELVTENEVREVFSEKTGIPITRIQQEEAGELLQLEEKIAEKVIGQPEAVKEVAAAIRRVRVRIGEEERPIAVFMFLGPTGVGKTELSKTLAEIYFGSRKKMVRIDMSEFASPYDLTRLVGDTGGSVKGLLTEPVRKNPFTLILLDEFEKAHPTIWDIFLQIFDDGRVTDGRGRVINFTNAILIATSNVGSKMILENLREGRSNEELKPVIKAELLEIFRPEFLNRFDDVIIFNALSDENIKAIAKLEINFLNKRLEEEQGVTVALTDDALAYLGEIGYSPEFGARFLKRAIREKIEDVLVIGILKGEYPRGSTVTITREMMEKVG